MQDIPLLNEDALVCSRLKRGDDIMVPMPSTIIQLGDLLHIVGSREDLNKVRLILGEEVDASLSTSTHQLQSVRIVVTNDAVLSKRLKDLDLKRKYDVVITRLNRAGIELIPSNNSMLQFGDILNVVGRPGAIEAITVLYWHWFRGFIRLYPYFYSGDPCCTKIRPCWRAADRGLDFRPYWYFRETLLVYAPKC